MARKKRKRTDRQIGRHMFAKKKKKGKRLRKRTVPPDFSALGKKQSSSIGMIWHCLCPPFNRRYKRQCWCGTNDCSRLDFLLSCNMFIFVFDSSDRLCATVDHRISQAQASDFHANRAKKTYHGQAASLLCFRPLVYPSSCLLSSLSLSRSTHQRTHSYDCRLGVFGTSSGFMNRISTLVHWQLSRDKKTYRLWHTPLLYSEPALLSLSKLKYLDPWKQGS